ncbi:enoyl-CoA hydratase-related protein [Gordonia sp. CPCC 205515]|uniref:enoyl-CoA hydratase/isomerase family protein n=1 Tax=Gordonia sp. CPCC 205515 TaxID=3140791 RepID=UPI003AF3F0AA
MTTDQPTAATLEITDGLATISLTRATAANALDRALKHELLSHVRAVADDESVRAVLLVADGKNFCVGQDLGEHVEGLRADPSTAMATVGADYNPLIRALAGLRVPVIAGINGACVGAGLGIALVADIRVAGDSSTYATAFTGIGLAADSGLSYTLAKAVGPSRAAGLLMLGDRFGAADALTWGLVHRVVPDAELREQATALATRLATGPTAAYREVKALLHLPSATLDDALEGERAAQESLGATRDHSAAVEAFLAKSKPVFTGS